MDELLDSGCDELIFDSGPCVAKVAFMRLKIFPFPLLTKALDPGCDELIVDRALYTAKFGFMC